MNRNLLRLPFVTVIATAMLFSGSQAGATGTPRVNVRLVTDQAEAVLAILAKRKTNAEITEADWQRVFSSEGYVRLKKREQSLKRSFEDTDFKTFAMSNELLQRAAALEETLAKWKHADISRSAGLALAYLPKTAHINAKIYPVIKPRENSFVFEVTTDPAIFLYLDPAVSREKFENTLAHELHHIGYGSSCPEKETSAEIEKLPKNLQTLIQLIGAFGEGFAMLAAAGGPDIHPHAVSDAKERARWDQDMANFNEDLKKVESFFLDVANNRLTEEQIEATASSFFGIQGPWYTVGWKMAVTIEKTYGRERLIESFCDHRKLLETYNKAAARHNRSSRDKLAIWSAEIITAIQTPRMPGKQHRDNRKANLSRAIVRHSIRQTTTDYPQSCLHAVAPRSSRTYQTNSDARPKHPAAFRARRSHALQTAA
jgi:Putative zinc dependent peptidase (DUF5700)